MTVITSSNLTGVNPLTPKTTFLSSSSSKFTRTGVNAAGDTTYLEAYSFSVDLTSLQIGDVVRFRSLLEFTSSAIIKYAVLRMNDANIVGISSTTASQVRLNVNYEFWYTNEGFVATGTNSTTNPVVITGFTPGVFDFKFVVAFSAATTDSIIAHGYRFERE